MSVTAFTLPFATSSSKTAGSNTTIIFQKGVMMVSTNQSVRMKFAMSPRIIDITMVGCDKTVHPTFNAKVFVNTDSAVIQEVDDAIIPAEVVRAAMAGTAL
mmetsp:Transcript_31484/g.57200  ORF Transcript_31484/g.57200 Transcript_31484/m.57200 type:complete len:101 (-) Transcript_31484:1562-1864(-)